MDQNRHSVGSCRDGRQLDASAVWLPKAVTARTGSYREKLMSSATGSACPVPHVGGVRPPAAAPGGTGAAADGSTRKRTTVLYVPDDHGLLADIEKNRLDWRSFLARASV
jgi:hypothetical protein